MRFLGTEDALVDELGSGTDGVVYATHASAVKIYRDNRPFQHELEAYLRLAEHGVSEICGHAVPQLIRFDGKLLALEMTMVQPPFVLDFGKARVDEKPDYPPNVLDDWREQVHEVFGSQAPKAWLIHDQLWRRHGIHYDDLKPGNITFAEE